MRTQQGALVWIGFGGILLGFILIVMQARFLGDPIIDFQFHIPQDPWALMGNSLITLSILFLVWLKTK
jgi:presenilin-like A22 family membrane protease